jgi:hypothetical protein
VSYDCYCDYDRPDVYSQYHVRARKPHRCDECDAHIRVGDRYEYTFGVWGGNASSFHTCADCAELKTFVQTNIPCLCWGHGNLREDIRTAIEDAYQRARDEVRGLAFSVGRLIIRQRRARAP